MTPSRLMNSCTCTAPMSTSAIAVLLRRPCHRRRLIGSSAVGLSALEPAPAAGAVVGDDLREHRRQGRLVDRLALADRHGPGRLVVVAAGDNAVRVGDDRAVVEEDVDVVPGRKQRADVPVEHEVGLDAALDRLLDRRVHRVDEVAHPLADRLLPRRQRRDVVVDARIPGVGHGPRVRPGRAPRDGPGDSLGPVEHGSPFHAEQRVDVGDGDLHVARAGPTPGDASAVVVLVHGITASHVEWRAVARLLAERGGLCLLAPDLRGRGRSAALPPPDGLGTHVEDLLAVLDDAGVGRAVLVGHSMGAFVVALVAAGHPERAASVVLVDGGLPLPVPAGVDVDAALLAVLGPALERLRRTFASEEEYVAFWRAHPAFAGRWDDDVEAYVRYDLTGAPG